MPTSGLSSAEKHSSTLASLVAVARSNAVKETLREVLEVIEAECDAGVLKAKIEAKLKELTNE